MCSSQQKDRTGPLPAENNSQLKGREPGLRWLQKVYQEVDGASHACKQEDQGDVQEFASA